MSGMKVKELMDSLKGDCYRFRVHYPEEWEFGLITGATFFGKRGLVLQHGEDDVSSFTLNPSWLSCEDEMCIRDRDVAVFLYLTSIFLGCDAIFTASFSTCADCLPALLPSASV